MCQRPERNRPAHGVYPTRDRPTIVFLTICMKDRRPWLASAEVHDLLCGVWSDSGAWLVGRYVVMTDHLHMFVGLSDSDVSLDKWVQFWKSLFSKRHGVREQRWQPGHWDRRLRTAESYDDKWEYVRSNPVRHGLVERPGDWPYQGELNVLAW